MRLQKAFDKHLDQYIECLYKISADIIEASQSPIQRVVNKFRDQPTKIRLDGGTITYNFTNGTVERIAIDPPGYNVAIPIGIYLDSSEEPDDILQSLEQVTEVVNDWAVGTDVAVGELRRIVDNLRSKVGEVLANPRLRDIEGALKAKSKSQFEALIGMTAQEEPLIDEMFERDYWVRRSLSYLIVVTNPILIQPPRLLSSTDDTYKLRGRYQHQEAYVIGFDDTPDRWFVYPVDGHRISKATTLTDAGVRRAMGYQFDADETGVRTAVEQAAAEHCGKPRPFHKQAQQAATTARIQGDLFIEVIDQYQSPEDAHDATNAMEALLVLLGEDTALDGARVLDMLRRTTVYVEEPTADADVHVMATQQVYELVEHAVLDASYRPPSLGDSSLASTVGELATGTGGDDPAIKELFDNPIELSLRGVSRSVRKDLQSLWDDSTPASKQTQLTQPNERHGRLTLPVDNHLLLFDDAWASPLSYREQEPVTVIVPEETLVTIPHDEHNEKTFELPAGAYRFYLGVPGVKPFPADRPEWTSTGAAPELDDHTPNKRF